jgi:hypothetical protein
MSADITSDSLKEELLDFLINRQFPHADLDPLASVVRVTGISDVEVDSVETLKSDGESKVVGSATIDVELEYGGGGDDGVTNEDSYPFTFDLILDEDGNIQSGRTLIDTSSFYDDGEDTE